MWRDTMHPIRAWLVDGRALIPLFLFVLHWAWWTLYTALAAIALFTILEWLGLSFPAAMRRVRRAIVGRRRPAVPSWKRRRYA